MTGVEEAAKNEKLIVYVGFDPTGANLHVGHVIPIMGLAHLQRSGHQPIALIGGGTALIGDPSGKQSEQALQPKETIEANAQSIKEQMKHFLRFRSENPALMLNNADWLCQLNLIDFLRDVGKHFSLGSMLARDSVKSGLDREQGISVTEFLYALLQSYDFMYLSEHHGCNMQMGGSDQWGNVYSRYQICPSNVRKKRAWHHFSVADQSRWREIRQKPKAGQSGSIRTSLAV